mmetsp:Transcript_72702/g.164970  ORF Transcript_72702/g.164970 Transcript_72702/m.164970 type:complete len:81 (-) Transcript_72702:91-333(-)
MPEESELLPERHPWLWFALVLAVMAALSIMCIFILLQGGSGSTVFQRKPQKAFQMQVLGGDDDDAEDGWPRDASEMRRKR